MKPLIKVLVSYHDRHKLIKSDIFTPIQTGRVNALEVFDDMLGDDSGENISFWNDYFCELSAIYWAWKNYDKIGNPDYIGHMHYRRQMLFGKKNYQPAPHGLIEFEDIDAIYLKEDLTSDENIAKIVSQYDVVIPKPVDVNISGEAKNNYEHYKKFHDITYYNKAVEIINKAYPKFKKYTHAYNLSHMAYFLDIFIMKKEIFFEYCEWIFGVLFKLYEENDFTDLDIYQKRSVGFISERLTGIFFEKLKKQKLKIKELPVSIIKSSLPYICEKQENAIPVVVTSSNEYVPYLGVFLYSLKKNIKSASKYIVHIIENDITEDNKKKIKSFIETDNIKVRFINIGNKTNDFLPLCEGKHFSSLTYARYFIADLLPEFDKCIYCDIDMLVLADIKELYDINLEGKAIAAARDWVYMGLQRKDEELEKHITENLHLTSVKDYFSNGTLLLDLKQLREENAVDKLCACTHNVKAYFVDQCIFNYYFKNRVKYISNAWNYQINFKKIKKYNYIDLIPIDIRRGLQEAEKDIKIIHYIYMDKPWLDPNEELADVWWSYARQTPFYEEILLRMIQHNTSMAMQISRNVDLSTIKNVLNLGRNKLKYFRYKLLSKITFGKKRKKYKEKRKKLKTLIKQTKQFFKKY